jgi:SAM-dependent methyltransferase
MTKRAIRRAAWWEEPAEFFGLPPALLRQAIAPRRVDAGEEPPAVRAARAELESRFMSPGSVALLERVRTAPPDVLSDEERSRSWRDYIFVCVNAERRAFERMDWYERVIAGVAAPLLEVRAHLVVVDYGCGSSLFTRMLAEDLGARVTPVSVDVGRHAVEFSVARNRLYSPGARGILIEDVMAPLRMGGADLILAYGVFEHLPNAPVQIQGLIDALGPGGMLIENYSGHSSEVPHKSDTWSAYRTRDENLDRLSRQLTLLYGILPERRGGVYERDRGERYWFKPPMGAALRNRIAGRLRRNDTRWLRIWRALGRRARAALTRGGNGHEGRPIEAGPRRSE